MGIAGDVLRRRLRTLSAHVESTSASVAAAAETEVIAYLQRSHGANYSPAAVAALRMPDFGDWAGYFPPVPSCKCGTDGLDVLDFGAGVADSGHVHGDAAVGKWNELRKNMYGMSSQLTQTRDLHIGIDLCAPAGAPVHAFADGEVFLTGVYPDAYDYGHVVRFTVFLSFYAVCVLKVIDLREGRAEAHDRWRERLEPQRAPVRGLDCGQGPRRGRERR